VSGNVSLYNETDGRAIPPTPVLGCIGIVEDVRTIPAARETGETLLLAAADTSLASQAALIEFLWRSAPTLSFARPEGDSALIACADPSALDWPSLRVIEAGA
jgi:hypothetical protein